MIQRLWVPSGLCLLILFALTQPAPGPLVAQAHGAVLAIGDVIDGVRDTGQFLPDDAILARVDDRVIRVGDYVESYFNSYAEFRPQPDSAGRVEFLNSMIAKEVIALTALEVNRPLNFEDRSTLRGHEGRVLSNVLFQRMVRDSIEITEDEIRREHARYGVETRLRALVVPRRAMAERVRLELLSGRISWTKAVEKYSLAYSKQTPEGDLGWRMRAGADDVAAQYVFDLEPGEISEPFESADGFNLVQCVEKRKSPSQSLESLRKRIVQTLTRLKTAERSERFNELMAAQVGMRFDSTSVQAVVAELGAPPVTGEGMNFTIDARDPHFHDADTSRVLATWDGGRMTLGQFSIMYGDQSPVLRQPLDSFSAVVGQVRAIALEPLRVRLARERGLEKDPQTLAMMARREEQMRVEHMYQDSILSKVWVGSDERRAYYDERTADFITYPLARFALLYADSKARADSVMARLKSGETASSILRSDSLGGRLGGSIQERYSNDRGAYHNMLFGELRPGEVHLDGPDRQGDYIVVQLIELDSGRQLPYEDVQNAIDQSLQNIKAEAMFKAFVERHRKGRTIEAHPELLMRVRLVDPLL